MDHTIKSIDNRLYRGYRIISGKEGINVNKLLLDAIKIFLETNKKGIKKYSLPEDVIERELTIKNIPDDVFKKLEAAAAAEENIDVDDLILNALYEYVFDKEVEYRKELLNIEEDDFH
ncbi:MAG: hypothetical protein ACMUJM_03260 [bacterium]